jgi:hypothetical protein
MVDEMEKQILALLVKMEDRLESIDNNQKKMEDRLESIDNNQQKM